MQPRGTETTMEVEKEGQTSQVQPRGRLTTKQKMLHRSEALREAASPPREPTPTCLAAQCSINFYPSSEVPISTTSPCTSNPRVVVSPSISCSNSPSRSPVSSTSPSNTLVPSPISRCSPQSASYLYDNSPEHNRVVSPEREELDPRYVNRVNGQNSEGDSRRDNASHSISGSRRRVFCDCQNQNCIKCIKSQEKSVNNNSSSINNNVVGSTNTLTVTRAGSRGKLRQQSSSQGSFEGSSSLSPCLSRDSSSEQYTDTTGTDLERFIPDTINRSMKDRLFMFRIEEELVNLAKDKSRTHFKFPPMSSYQRMLVHRCAAYFGMDHNIESSGKCVVVNKTKNTRIPDVQFKEHMKDELLFTEESRGEPTRRSILKRDANSMDDYSFKSPDRQYSLENRRSKSFEEREEEYEKARRRIFNRELHDSGSVEDFGWPDVPWSSTDSENSRCRLQLPDQPHRRYGNKLVKVHSEDMGDTMRPYVAKSYSFGGYGGVSVLNRGDSVMSTHSAGPRLLTKQDSAASSVSWRLSPSSSGYKSQSQMSESVTPSPTSTPHPVVDCSTGNSNNNNNGNNTNGSSGQLRGDGQVYWAVTDIESVPAGSILIDPKTYQPIRKEDGSLYHYDPNNPPEFLNNPEKTTRIDSPQKPPSSPVRVKEETPSPKKQHRPVFKTKSNVTNTATSPSMPTMPYSAASPPMILNQSKSFSYPPGSGDVASSSVASMQPPPPPPQGYFGPSYVSEGYQQPCIIYAPASGFGMHIQQPYDNRVEVQPVQEIATNYFVPENTVNASQPIAYQQPSAPYWSGQSVQFYQNPPAAAPAASQSHKFALPVSPQPGFVPTGYSQAFMQQQAQAPQNCTELVPLYQNPPMQVVYTNPPAQGNVIYPPTQPPVVYTQNPVYQNPVYPPPNVQYAPSVSSSNSCPASNTPFPNQIPEHSQANFLQLAHGMGQLSLGQSIHQNPNFKPAHFDGRVKTFPPKCTKFGNSKGIFMGSSQSSTGTNSPAATVVSGYCPQNPNMYRTPPETPPSQFAYNPNFPMTPMVYRQMSNVRASTPGTARSSRSPTPASDISHFERQRVPLPPAVYHGTPYFMQSDTRLTPRSQPSNYRQAAPIRPQSANFSGDYSRSHNKGRKSKGNKQTPGLPPSGKQSN